MHPEVEKLLKLQDVDGRLEILRRELERRPKEIEAQEASIQELIDRREHLAGKITGKKVELDKAKLEVATQQGKAEDARKKQAGSSSTGEFNALNTEIDRAQAQEKKFAEKASEVGAEIEKFQGELTIMDSEIEVAKEDHQEEEQSVLEDLEEIHTEAQKLMAAREEAVAPISEESLEYYDRLFARYKQRSVVSAEGGVCSGCHMTVNPQMMNQLRSGNEVISCKNCSRILFL